jgi:simple sugar transport system ATP-binding protein
MTYKGRTIVLITHNVKTAVEVSDRIAVLKGGKLKGIFEKHSAKLTKLISLMFDDFTLDKQSMIKKPKLKETKTILEIKNLKVADERGYEIVKDVTLHLNRGEIVGLAGIEGNGQNEIAEAILNLRKIKGGTITFNGEEITQFSTKEIQKKGIMLFAAHNMLVDGFDVKNNSILDYPEDPEFSIHGFLNLRNISRHAKKLIQNYNVRPPSIDVPTAKLSGGNKQRVVMGRKLYKLPRLLIALNPAKDLDFKSTDFLYEKLIEFKNNGGTVLFICVDLDAIIKLCDRAYVINRGKITGEFQNLTQKTKRQIGELMVNV